MSRSHSPLKDRLIFVVGARRSGTNWLQRIVAAHPDVVAVPSETYLFGAGLSPLVEHFHHGAAGSGQPGLIYADRAVLMDSLRDFCDTVFQGLREVLKPDAKRILERTPDHVRHLRFIGEVYPDGRFLHIIRDGRDVSRSLRSQTWGPESIEDAAEEWRSAIEAAREAAPALQHYLEVRHEDLFSDTPGWIGRIFEWLALDAQPETVERALAEARVHFTVDPEAPEVATGKWRDAFSPDDLATFDRVAGTTLSALGYAPPAPRPRDIVTDPTQPKTPDQPKLSRPPVKRLVGRLRRGILTRGRPGKGSSIEKELRSRLRANQAVVNRFLDVAARRDWEGIGSLLSPTVQVQIIDHRGAWQGRGSEARTRLTQTLAADPALRGRQIRSDIHAGLPTWSIVAAFRLSAEAVVDRVWALTLESGAIGRVSYYVLPTREPQKDNPATA